MNPKIKKLKIERSKNDVKISELQSRNSEIDDKITELENLDIIGIVRESGLMPEMLGEIIRAIKNKPLLKTEVKPNEKEDDEIYDEN